MCARACLATLALRLNHLGHIVHLYGFSPVCVRSWSVTVTVGKPPGAHGAF